MSDNALKLAIFMLSERSTAPYAVVIHQKYRGRAFAGTSHFMLMQLPQDLRDRAYSIRMPVSEILLTSEGTPRIEITGGRLIITVSANDTRYSNILMPLPQLNQDFVNWCKDAIKYAVRNYNVKRAEMEAANG